MGMFDAQLVGAEKNIQDELRLLVQKTNDAGGTYHKMDLGSGLIFHGDYDMAKYVEYYHLPADLIGKKVLDIGTCSGFFGLECARRGAGVTGIDIWDYTPASRVAELLKLDFRYVQKSLYDLDSAFGQFDLVICGSLILHLADLIGAIRKMRAMCSGLVILATASTPDSEMNSRPLLEFIGQKAVESDYWTYWAISAEALKRMLLASGFSRIEKVSHFILASEPDRMHFETPHVVVSASV